MTRTRGGQALGRAALATLWVALCAGCIAPAGRIPAGTAPPLRISEVARSGDALRRASTELVLDGLAAPDADRARTHFERAIALDATNPYAYLALASQEIQWGDVGRGRQSLRQAELLLHSEHFDSPRVAPHLQGLHGRADARAAEAGGPEGSSGQALLDEARRLAPGVWGDGWLTAAELR